MGRVLRRAVPRILLSRVAARLSTALLIVVVLATVSACAGGGAASPPRPAPSFRTVAVPPGGVSLAQLGFQHGPVGAITVPEDARTGLRVDQPNMVTMTFVAPAGEAIGAWLRGHLAEGGFRLTAESAEGLVFEGHAWAGAFTVSGEGSALTLRQSPGAA